MKSEQAILENRSLIKGFLKPLFYDEFGRGSALGPTDFAKVRDGYACARCLAEFVTYLQTCPICGLERDLAKDLEAPDPLHVNHLKERIAGQGKDSGPSNTFDDFMRQVQQNKDIDHATIKSLMPSRRGLK